MADSPQRSASLESTVADIVMAATELMPGQVRPGDAVVERVMETLAAAGGIRSVRRVRVQHGQYDDSIGRYRAGSRVLHRIRIPASGEAIEVEIAGPDDPGWVGTEQVWRLHSTLAMITAALSAPRSTDPVEQLLWHSRSVVAQLERDRWSIRSSAGTRVLGYSADVTRNQEPLSLVDPRDRLAALRAYVRTISGRLPTTTIDLRVLAADGGYRVLEATFVNMPSGGGRRTVAVYGVDLTAQRADAARLREFVLRLDGGVLVVDETGRVRLVNDVFTRMFGTVAGGWLGQHQREALRAVVAACHDEVATRQRLASIGRARRRQVERLDLADGRVLELDRTPLLEHGLDLGALWQFRDVSTGTARSAAAEDRALDVALEKQNRVLATVSHELRTPLTAVVSFADLLAETAQDGLDDERRAAAEVVARNTRRLLTLVDDLLLLSRLESTRVSLRHGAVDVPTLVATAIADRRSAAAELDIELIGDVGEGPALTGDAGRLNQVLANLIHNALKFSPRGGVVRVAAAYESPEWTITVTDSGMGIPATELEDVTRSFERGSNAVAAGIAGSGLGLAICRELVALHRGRMSIKSWLNVGTAVRIMLPDGEEES